MGNVNMEAYQVHDKGSESVADHLARLDLVAQQVADLPTFTSNDRIFLEKLPALPTEEGKTVLTATTDGQGNTDLSYEQPEVEGNDIAPVFDDTEAYNAGDLVYYDGVLYKFDVDHAAGAWDPSEVTQTSVAEEFNQLKNTFIQSTASIDTGSISSGSGKSFTLTFSENIDTSKSFIVVYTGRVDLIPTAYLFNESTGYINVFNVASAAAYTSLKVRLFANKQVTISVS